MSLLAALVLVAFADEWFTYWPSGALESIRADLGLSYAEVGVVVASLSAGGLLGHGYSIAADFVNRRWLTVAGAIGYAAALITFGLGRSLPVLVLAGFVWGMSSDGFVHGCEVALIDLCPEDELPVALGRVNGYGAVGDLLGPLTLAAAIGLGFSWRAPFLLAGGLMVAYAAVLACQHFPERRVEPPEAPVAAVLSVIRDRRVVLLAVIDGLFGLLDEPLLGFLNAFLEQIRGWSPAAGTTLISVIVAAGLCGYLGVGLVSSRLSAQRLLAVSGSAMTLGLCGLLSAPVPWLEVVAGILFGLCGAIFYSVLQATYLGLRPGQAGTTGAVVSMIGLAGIGFPALVGAVSDAHGLAAGVSLYLAVPVVMLSLLLVER